MTAIIGVSIVNCLNNATPQQQNGHVRVPVFTGLMQLYLRLSAFICGSI
jgi:hypothetical protein